jgi:hypothetical protein
MICGKIWAAAGHCGHYKVIGIIFNHCFWLASPLKYHLS